MNKKNAKSKKLAQLSTIDKNKYNMKVVTSDKCAACRQCQRGLDYLEKMSEPGAIGFGVPCILTKGKAYK